MLTLQHQKIQEFFRKLYPHSPWPGCLIVNILRTTINQEGKKVSKSLTKDFLTVEGLAEINYERWAELQDTPNLGNVYFTAAYQSFNGASAKKSNSIGSGVLWADKDNCKQTDLEEILTWCPIRPNIVNWTGNGFHFYWILQDICFDVNEVEAAVRKVHRWVEGDKTSNINRLMRVPYTYNVKPDRFKTDGTFPFCEVVWENLNVTYPLIGEVLAASLGVKEFKLAPEFVDRFIIKGEYVSEETKRSGRDFTIAIQMFKAGHTEHEVRSTLSNPQWGCSTKVQEKGEPYLELTVKEAYKKYLQEKEEAVVYDDGEFIYRTLVNKSGATEVIKISNFCIKPICRIELTDPNQSQPDHTLRISVKNKEWVAEADTFVSSIQFIKEAGIPLLAFSGNHQDWQHYISYLSLKDLSTRYATKTIGWSDGQFISSSGVWYKPEVEEGKSDRVLEYYDTGLDFTHCEVSEESLTLDKNWINELIKNTKLFHKPSASLLALGWFLASVYSPQIRDANSSQFPMLSINGAPGTGKTTMAKTMASSLLGVGHEFSGKITPAALKRALTYINALPVFMDEMEVDESTHGVTLVGMLRLLWQRGSVQSMVGSNQIGNFRLRAPVVFTNLGGLADEAALSRTVSIRLQQFNRTEGPIGRNWFGNLPPGVFLKAWLNEPPVWIERIGRFAQGINSNDRQRHSFGCVVAPLIHLAQESRGDIPELNVDYLARLWQEQSSVVEVAGIPETFDILIANLIRSFELLPHTGQVKGYFIDGNGLLIHRAQFVDKALAKSKELKINYQIDRNFLNKGLRDMEETGEVIYHRKAVYRCGTTDNFFKIVTDRFPLVKEAVNTAPDITQLLELKLARKAEIMKEMKEIDEAME